MISNKYVTIFFNKCTYALIISLSYLLVMQPALWSQKSNVTRQCQKFVDPWCTELNIATT
jgi:hypothetical protein